MLTRTPTLRALLRPIEKPQTQFIRSFSRLQYRTSTPPLARPNLTPTFRALPIHLQSSLSTPLQTPIIPSRSLSTSPAPTQAQAQAQAGSATQWTRFETSYSYSSVRTFSSSRAPRMASVETPDAPAASSSVSPEVAQQVEKIVEEITDLYGTARDEFELASEETDKNSVYAEDDRAGAREELDKLLEYYNGVLGGGDEAVAHEVRRRVGGRIRELEHAVVAMEERAINHD